MGKKRFKLSQSQDADVILLQEDGGMEYQLKIIKNSIKRIFNHFDET
jgi:nucleoside-triphosphatase THEP1